MKEIIGKTNKSTNDSLPNRLLHKDNSYVTDSIGMANILNDFYTSIGPNPKSSKNFRSYLPHCEAKLTTSNLKLEEIRKAFSSLKTNKSPRLDDVSVKCL